MLLPPIPDSGGTVSAVGVDLVDVGRVRAALRRHPERFARRVLSPAEAEYCLSRPDPAPHVAARFAAKEAVIKCLGGGCALHEIEVVRALSGSPSVTLHGRAALRAGGRRVLISLSHLEHLAGAFAVLVNDLPAPKTFSAIAAIDKAAHTLESAGIGRAEARMEARLLVQHVTGITPERLRLYPEQPLDPTVYRALRQAVARRANREPLAYIVGEKSFYGLLFTVTPAVLIPRPETEFIVEAILVHLSGRALGTVADVGTGSGAIAVAVALHAPGSRVWATDISPDALVIARKNADRHGQKARVHFAEGDLLTPLANADPFDVIASNPPYITPDEIELLEPEVRVWEPRIALGVRDDALHFYRRLAAEAPLLLAPGGLLVVEVGQGQADDVAALWKEAGLTEVMVRPDYAGIPRVVSGIRARTIKTSPLPLPLPRGGRGGPNKKAIATPQASANPGTLPFTGPPLPPRGRGRGRGLVLIVRARRPVTARHRRA